MCAFLDSANFTVRWVYLIPLRTQLQFNDFCLHSSRLARRRKEVVENQFPSRCWSECKFHSRRETMCSYEGPSWETQNAGEGVIDIGIQSWKEATKTTCSQVHRSLFRRGFNSTIFDTGKMYTWTHTHIYDCFHVSLRIVSKPIFITPLDRSSWYDCRNIILSFERSKERCYPKLRRRQITRVTSSEF